MSVKGDYKQHILLVNLEFSRWLEQSSTSDVINPRVYVIDSTYNLEVTSYLKPFFIKKGKIIVFPQLSERVVHTLPLYIHLLPELLQFVDLLCSGHFAFIPSKHSV